MTPEEQARLQIDRMLVAAGWTIQDLRDLNLGASLGVAVREFPLKTGEADYLLFVNRQAVGVVEAKPEGDTLSGVHEQTTKYSVGVPANLPHVQLPLPFGYESTGVETLFTDLRDPDPRQRRVFSFHRPETLREWIAQGDTLRKRLRYMPSLATNGLRDCQVEAITNLEKSFAEARPRALIQMATGSGKTFTAVSFIYRLIKFANAKRVLFLVDRNNLGRQTFREFQQYITPDDGRKFTELYNVQHLTSNALDPVNRVCIATIQRVYSMLRGEELDAELEEQSLFDIAPESERPKEVVYSPQIPIETFDIIITDECHRSIYNLWRQVLDYFDAFLIGLTATPSKQTIGFFNQNLVMEYSHERAVADGVNVGFDVYRIKTQITERGSQVDAGFYVDRRDKLTRRMRWEKLDEQLAYTPNQLDRDVVAVDQIRTVIRTFKEKLPTEIFPGRTEVPKTLIFAKDDSHAEDIVHIVREVFGKGNDFAKKITYKTTGERPEDLIASFRNSYNPRIAVTVDMISTGTDIKPLECLLFMRGVDSAVYFEQMKGRGTRTISPTDLNAVTPGDVLKTHFIIVDAVGVCENDKTDSRPLERKRTVPFEKLVQQVALGIRDEDTLSSLAGRLARLDREIGEKDQQAIVSVIASLEEAKQSPTSAEIASQRLAMTSPLRTIVNRLLDAVDADKQIGTACAMFATATPTDAQIQSATEQLTNEACAVFDNPKFRNTIIAIKQRNEQVIDTVSQDTIITAGFDAAARERAQKTVATFKQFIEANKDELTALQILYNLPYARRQLTYAEITQLADAIQAPPYRLTPDALWQAYEQLERARVRGAGTQKILTNLVSLVRFAIGANEVLEPFSATVERRFAEWLAQAGRAFTPEQREWLVMIKDHITTTVEIGWDDFELTPFSDKGGRVKAYNLFGQGLDNLMQELNTVLVA
ncbi:MAG: DEAD/DEAH box helicase family protein [Chloroflexi bacterium]|nr:DEAD/DEAH box helicase family protein [Chloroflexota bacterium]